MFCFTKLLLPYRCYMVHRYYYLTLAVKCINTIQYLQPLYVLVKLDAHY